MNSTKAIWRCVPTAFTLFGQVQARRLFGRTSTILAGDADALAKTPHIAAITHDLLTARNALPNPPALSYIQKIPAGPGEWRIGGIANTDAIVGDFVGSLNKDEHFANVALITMSHLPEGQYRFTIQSYQPVATTARHRCRWPPHRKLRPHLAPLRRPLPPSPTLPHLPPPPPPAPPVSSRSAW